MDSFLATVPLFRELGAEELREIAPLIREERYAAGTMILNQGGQSEALYFLRSGRLAVKVRSMQFRGLSHWELGDQRAGVADLEEALRLGRAGGVGFETAMCYSNLAEVVARRDGPAQGLPILREGIEFAERRGLVFAAMWMRATEPLLLFETGAWDEVLERGTALLEWERARGTTQITRIILALDAKEGMVATRGWTETSNKRATEDLGNFSDAFGLVYVEETVVK